jgi:hypothetical protein
MDVGPVRSPMNVQAALQTSDASARLTTQDALAWYKVVGIELGLLAAILASLLCGDLLIR